MKEVEVKLLVSVLAWLVSSLASHAGICAQGKDGFHQYNYFITTFSLTTSLLEELSIPSPCCSKEKRSSGIQIVLLS